MANTQGLTNKPITEEDILDAEGNVVASHQSTLITDPNAANAVQGADAQEYPSANATERHGLNSQSGAAPSVVLDPDVANVNEVQTLSKTGTVTSGTYKLTFNGHTTANIAYDATAAAVKTALVALSDFEADDLTVTGGPTSTTPTVITFVGDYAATDVGPITVDSTGLVGGGTYGVVETTKGVRADRA